MTEVFPALQDLLVPKETLVLLVLQVPLVQLDLPAYLVPQVPKEPKGHLVKQVQKERLEPLDLLALLAPLVTSSTRSPSLIPSRAERVGTSTPAR